jgi:hypothetical protein
MRYTQSSFSVALFLSLGLPSALLLACQGSSPSTDSTGAEGIPGTTTAEMSNEDESTSTTGGSETDTETETTAASETETDTDDGDDDDDDDSGGSLVKFDLSPVPDSPPLEEGCGMVDFLFVIDNSGSMSDEQIALINNFPTFIGGIEATLETVDTINVGVTTTDDYFYNVQGCTSIGSLVVQTGGSDSSNSLCGPYEEGDNFMTQEDMLDVAFSCAARVGTDGSADERPMQAVLNAVNGSLAGPDQCNEGFIREDALLVIVIITDEPDQNTPGNPMAWYQTVVDAKDGIPENVVVMSLINTPNGICGFDFAFSIAEFTMLFGVNGFMADICVADYAPVFQQAIGIIDVACENFLQN